VTPVRPLRVLHCPWNLAGQQAALAAAERGLGLDSRNVALFESARGFPADEDLAHAGQRVRIELARFRLLWRAMRWADVVHFAFGQSILVPNPFPSLLGASRLRMLRRPLVLYARLLWYADLPLLKRLGKTLVVSWHGDDARQGDRSRALFDISIAGELPDGYYTGESDRWKRAIIARFETYADRHYALNPDLMHVLPAATRFLPYASFDTFSVEPVYPSASAGTPLRFAHAPSHRGAKGTRYILDAVQRLRAEGLAFDFDLVEGVPRRDALRRLVQADVVVDQLLAGWYGGLGLEAMALGKVLVAYIRDTDLHFVPEDLRRELPVISATPSDIADVMRRLIATPREELAKRGRAGRAFAERYHAPATVASITAADYQALRRHPAGAAA
jgi:hypothetical protein